MERVLTSGEMSRADAFAIDSIGIPSLVLMERAALGVAEEIFARGFDLTNVLVVCGTGNNAGDGVALARLLAEKNISCDLLFVGEKSRRSEQLKKQIEILQYYGINEVLELGSRKYSLIVDAVFGIGLSRDVKGIAKEVIDALNKEEAVKLAIDIPSGINADNGHVLGTAFKADLTVTFAAKKAGHMLYPGKMFCNEVVVKDIGIPVSGEENAIYAIDGSDFLKLPQRSEYGNKSTFGKLLVIAGSGNMCGAAFFAAASALKCGAGMVKILTERQNKTPLSVLLPEALISAYEGEEEALTLLADGLDWADGVVIGPGLDTNELSAVIFSEFCRINTLPAVLDADALNLLSAQPELWNKINFKTVVTPHIGEMSRLCSMSAPDIQSEPIAIAKGYAKDHGTVCVLKDAVTVTAYPQGNVYINTSGCSALATAGSGDVLSGILGAFLVRYRDCSLPLEAMGVYLHGRAGEEAGDARGKSAANASDILAAIEKAGLL